MTDAAAGLLQLEKWMQQALAVLSGPSRRALFRQIGLEVRERNAARMAAQTGPEGEPWAARKPRREKGSHGKVKKAARMMLKLRAMKRLRVDASDAGVDVGFKGRNAIIARVHHFGGVDYVDRDVGVKAEYVARPLLGLPSGDVHIIRAAVLKHIAEKLPF